MRIPPLGPGFPETCSRGAAAMHRVLVGLIRQSRGLFLRLPWSWQWGQGRGFISEPCPHPALELTPERGLQGTGLHHWP